MKLISSKLTCKMMVCTLCSIMMAFLFMGCERDVYNPNNGKDDEKTPNSFDFSTTSSIQVNVKYDIKYFLKSILKTRSPSTKTVR